MGRTPKGAVGLFPSRGRLSARWSWGGRRFYLSLGLADTPANRQAVRGRVAQIERDLAYGEFTGDLSKYQPQAKGVAVTPTRPDLLELWEKYTEFRRPSLSPNTLGKIYKFVAHALEGCPCGLDSPAGLRDWLLKNYTPDSAKRVVVQVNACCRWAVQSKLMKINPFAGMAATISIPKASKPRGDQIDPFSPDERAAIMAGFDQSQYYKCYAPLVRFLFLTGCRPGEALALEWGHIEGGFIHFQQSTVTNKNQVKTGLKTQSSRKFPINRQLQELLDGVPRVGLLVFPALGGGVLHFANFNRRAWHSVLSAAGVRYRRPYQMRHTFITEALRRGLSVQDVAKLVGNSAQVIYAHYAGASRELVVPEL